MPHLFVESDAAEPGPFRFTRDAEDLLALLSFGVAEPFGSMHPLTQLVRRLRRERGLDLTPLLTFYDRNVEDAADAANLEAAWQDAAALRECVVAVRAALADDAEAVPLTADFPAIPPLLGELEGMAAWAAEREARIRISFSLDS